MDRVLVLCPQSPFPLHNGSAIRSFQSIRFLKAMGYLVDVLYLSREDDYNIVKKGLNQYCDNVYLFKRSRIVSFCQVLLGVFSAKPFQVLLFFSLEAKTWVRRHEKGYSLIYCNNIRTAEYAIGCSCTKVIDYVDAISMNYEKSGKLLHGFLKYIYLTESNRCKKYERYTLNKFERRIIISEVDRDYLLGSVMSYRIDVVPNYINIGKRFVNHKTDEKNIVFIGSMYYEPNVQAADFFVKRIFPLIQSKEPDAKFYIVGKNPDKRIIKLESESVVVTGFVDSVWDYMNKAAVIVVPMISGSGLQNKIIEAMAVKACVVTTPIGFEGLVVDKGAPIVADCAELMAGKILWLLNNPIKRRNIGDEGFEYVNKYYSEEVVYNQFKAALEAQI